MNIMKSNTKIYTGTSGWSYEHWVNRFYPEELEKNEWFPYYAQRFNTVELNMSFYRYPFPNMLKGWKNKMPETFKMTFKANRQITHYKKFHEVEDDLRKFYGIAKNLQENTGCILFQTPPSFQCDEGNFRVMLKFMDVLDSSFNNVIEFRHSSWWNKDVIKLLKAHNVCFCTVSGLDMPPDVIISADFGYFRFHGPEKPYASEYSEEQLINWADAITQKTKQNNLKEIYCYFNNDYFGYAIENARRMNQLLKEKLNH
jgi:uncharacterized protein YecE (DUF72 family)